jgi:hypothetical protein
MPDTSEIEKNEEMEPRVKYKLEAYINGEDNRCKDGKRRVEEEIKDANEEVAQYNAAPEVQPMIEEENEENEPKSQKFIGLGSKASRKGLKCCIVNMMDTPKDHLASIRSYGKSDLFFYYLMEKMNLTVDIPPSWNTSMYTATEMQKQATQFLPVNHKV